MAGKDKHPPLDPNRWSTNKRVKAKTTTSVGTAYKTASGSKRIKPGSASTTSAKTAKAYETKAMSMKKDLKKGLIDRDKLKDMKRFLRNRAV